MIYLVQTQARESYAHIVEEILVDLAQLFSEQIQSDLSGQDISTASVQNWAASFDRFKQRKFAAKILNVLKSTPNIDCYITNEKGIVVYSSRDNSEIGKDYSKWRDVSLTLTGQYGARSSREDKNNRMTSIYYVGAPILRGEKIIGTVSIIKARATIVNVLDYFFHKMILGVTAVVILALIFGALLFFWITSPIENLKSYALRIAEGKKVPLPTMPHRELKELGGAFEHMRITVEGRKTIEKFVESLVHELKSPLAAIRGSAELMQEPMSEAQRDRFLKNILNESSRSHKVLETILSISGLESLTSLEKVESINLVELVEEAQDGLVAICKQGDITFENKFSKNTLPMQGDAFLLAQVIRNVLQNAVEFSEAGQKVTTEVLEADSNYILKISDTGCGIPDFAQKRLFEKFFSLARPRTGKRGTGLGLNFVREVVLLHKGEIRVVSPIEDGRGTRVEITLPKDFEV